MKINGIEFLMVVLSFEGNTRQEVEDANNTFGLGTIRLENNRGQKLVLDSGIKKVKDFEIEVEVEEHKEIDFKEEGSKQDLDSLADLKVASIHLGEEYEIEPDYITLWTKQNECVMAIELKVW